MKLLLIILSFCCLACCWQEQEIQQKWLSFRKSFNRKYKNLSEESQRFEIFKSKLQTIWQHNERFNQGLESYEMTINSFSDMDFDTVQKYYMGLTMTENDEQLFRNATLYSGYQTSRNDLPSKMDWRESGAITPVKNQRSCGSCWAFASVAALEAHHFLKHKQTVILSEQNLVDCVTQNSGCSGGWMVPCFEYVHNNPGINSEHVYPYEGVNGQCRYQPYPAAINEGFLATRPDDERHMKLAVALEGPVTVAIHANQYFMNYKRGVFDDPNCSDIANHAILVVGYGTENGQDYWLAKNSWGSHWGDEGYIKMARNKDSQCAIAKYVSYPTF